MIEQNETSPTAGDRSQGIKDYPRLHPLLSLSAAELGWLFGVRGQAVGQWVSRQNCPRGRDGTFDLRAVLEWREDRLKKDEVEAGSNSPALERYREEKAALARLERLARERVLVPRDDLRLILTRLAIVLRGAGECLQRDFGPAAKAVLDEALDDYRRELERSLEQ